MMPRLQKFWMLPWPRLAEPPGAFNSPAVSDVARLPVMPRLVVGVHPLAGVLLAMDFDGRRAAVPADGGR